jgi:hypothetical protein
MRDQFNLSGDFRRANVAIQSKLDHARLATNTLLTTPTDLQELRLLLDTLRSEISGLDPSKSEAGLAVAESTDLLLSTAASPAPNKTLLRSLGEGVRYAAKTVGEAGPGIVTTVEKIVGLVSRIAG